jgi:hypothetical protein
MSEKLCALLVRLYPSGFRQSYGEEALWLIGERVRDEKGVLRQLRLGFDLIQDLVATVPLYGARSPITQISRAPNGALSFMFVGCESPSATSLFVGFLVSFTLMAVFSLAFSGSGSGGKWNFPRLPLAQVTPPRADPQPASGGSGVRTVDAAMRHQVIQEITANLKNHYFDAATAEKMAGALQANESTGAYSTITDSRDLGPAHSAVAGNEPGRAHRSPVQRSPFAKRAASTTVRRGPGAVQSRHAATELHLRTGADIERQSRLYEIQLLSGPRRM